MNINLIYEINAREYINCILLEQELIRRGYNARIFAKTESFISDSDDSWTVIPNSYNTQDVDYYKYTFNTRNHLIAYPCEQLVNHVLPNYFDHSKNNAIKHIPILCWGEDYYNFIKSLGYDMTDCTITGAVQLDFCRPEFSSFFSSRLDIANKYSLKTNKKWILFISDFVYASEKMRNFLIYEGSKDKNLILRRFEYESIEINKILDWFELFLKQHDDYIIIYRRHPAEFHINRISHLVKKYRNQFFAIYDLNIKEWINNCDVITCWNSTVGIECFAAKKDILLIRPTEFPSDTGLTEYSFYKNYPRIKNYEQFENEIKAADHSELRKYFEISDLYSITEIPAFIRVADAIENIINNRSVPDVEFNYDSIRKNYLKRNKVRIKSYIKKIYQALYSYCNIEKIPILSKKYALEEWKASADNIKKHDMWATKIKQYSTKIIQFVRCHNVKLKSIYFKIYYKTRFFYVF